MTYENTTRQLEQLAENFYNVCKTMLAVYDRDKQIICSYPHKMCDFCALIRSDEGLTKRCIIHDKQALEKCDKTHKAVKYYCHMGLVEVIRPIVKDGIILGYLQFGQITDDKERTLPLEKIEALGMEFDKSKLKSSLIRVKYRSPTYIDSISKILEMSAAYILLNGIYPVKSGGLAHSVQEYIKNHISEELSSVHLCRLFSVSRTTLFNISKSYFGCGIQEYIIRLRMEKAHGLLLTTDIPINEIAEQIGINDPGYFSKRFKIAFGMTPRELRNRYNAI